MNEKNSISSDLNNSSLNSNETKNNRIKLEKPEQSNNKINNLGKLISNNYSKKNSEKSSPKKWDKKSKKNKIEEEILNLNYKIKHNNNEIQEIKKKLINLKQEKKKKQEDIINLLSNKESIEEIYKNEIYFLINKNQTLNENIDENMNKIINKSDNFDVKLSEIKEIDQNKYIEQIINMTNDIFQKNSLEINDTLKNILHESYQLLNDNKLEIRDDLIINDFFSKISLYISNQSLGKFKESEINLLLKYLIQINTINQKLEKYIKFVNKKYKEQKKELNNSLNDLDKKNKILQEKKVLLENQLKENEEKELNISNNNSSTEKENLDKNIRSGKENKIIYSKKYISKNNNYFRKSQTNRMKENLNLIDNNKENQKEAKIEANSSNILKNSKKENIKYNNEKEKNRNKNILIKEKIDNNSNEINKIKNENIVYLKEKRKIDRKSLLTKVNDYTFNISINNDNKNIFTENDSKNNFNHNMKDKILIIKKGKKEKIENNNRTKSELYLLDNNKNKENEQNENGEIITYKISTLNKNQLQEISKNENNIKINENKNLIQNCNSNVLIKNKGYNKFASKNKLYKKGNCLINNDEKNHNFISIINITNNAPIKEKSLNNFDDEKIFNIDNLDNENIDDLNIKTMKIKSNILKDINENNNNFDINNNDYYFEKENKENNFSLTNNRQNNNQIKQKSENSKKEIEYEYEIDLKRIINKNSEINNINESSLKNKNLSLQLTSSNTNYISPKICDSNLTEVNQIFLNETNTLSPLKTKHNKSKYKNDFFKNLNSNTLKITKTKEVNIKEIKSNKINILKIKKLSNTINSNNSTKQLTKLFSTSRDKISILPKKLKSKSNRISMDSFNNINEINNEKNENQRRFFLNKINKNNLSWDKFESNNNKLNLKAGLSQRVIKKLKLINLPISKNQKMKKDNNIEQNQKDLDKNINNKYSFYQYINNINFDNKYISMTKQSICYYRIYAKKNIKLNWNENRNLNIENFGFSKGYISIILKSDLLHFIPKINNNNEITIILKNIIGVQLEQGMQNIINEIENSKKEQEKIETKNNLFIFNLLITDFEEGKIECAFDNYEIYIFWMKFLEQIAEYYRNNDNIFNI